jgi:hypothetical protein
VTIEWTLISEEDYIITIEEVMKEGDVEKTR